jgi:hypothetical protein
VTLTRKTLVLPLAGALLVGAAGAVAAASSDPAAGGSGTTVVPAADPSASPATDATDPTTRPAGPWLREDGILDDVLDGLVADGTLTADQQQAILDALVAERDARIARAQQHREQLRTFLEDGVIAQEEFDQLPEDSRLRDLAGIMDDGQITTDELRGLGGFGGFGGRGHGFGRGFGPGMGPGPMWDLEEDDTTDGGASS